MQQTKLTTYTVPGEHDILEEDGKSYLNRFGKGIAKATAGTASMPAACISSAW